MDTERNTNESAEGTSAAVYIRPFTFNFKKLNAAKLEEFLSGFEPDQQDAVRSYWPEVVEGKGPEAKGTGFYKRPSETHQLQLPQWAKELPELAQQQILKLVADYVKREFIDQYAEVGDHSWETIEKAAASSSRGGVSFDYSEDAFELFVTGIREFVTAGVKNAEVGKRMAAAVEGKLTKAAIHRNLNRFDEDTVGKVVKWLELFAEHAATAYPDDADELAVVLEFLLNRCSKHLQSDKNIDPTAYL